MRKLLHSIPSVVVVQYIARSLLFGTFLSGCERSHLETKSTAPVITVAHPVESEMVEWNEYTGLLEGVNRVDVRAHVSSYLDSIRCKEWSIVKESDLLFMIDSGPYKAALDQAKGQLASAQAKLTLANWELTLAKQLREKKAYSQEIYDQKLADELQAAGDAVHNEYKEVKAFLQGAVDQL